MPNATLDCPEFEADLSALLDGELAPERAAAVRLHASGCAPCRDQLARFERLAGVLASAPSPSVAASLFARLEARIAMASASDTGVREAAPAPAPGRAWLRRAATAVAAAAAGVALYLAIASREPAPRADEPFPRQIARRPEPAASVPAPGDLAALPDEDLGIALELETVEDFEVIANLELLELLLAAEAG